jgi:hypothetical protein
MLRHFVLPLLVVLTTSRLALDQRAWAQNTPRGSTAKSKTKPEGTRDARMGRGNGSKAAADIEGIGTYTSKNFIVHTDLPATEVDDLLKRLETMLELISHYWGRPLSGTIEMYVVKEMRRWPAGSMPPEAAAMVASGGGLTINQTLSNGSAFLAKATVYATADRGTPQHEAVHAYCGQTFGRTGPTWYSEGMAEMGQYWRTKDASVNADRIVIQYLRATEVKSLNEIVNGIDWSGDSWENYAWRWALCHLLANNPNYAPRFRPLGLGLLTKQNVSFEETYGDMSKEISFEYREFIKQMEAGLRVDLTAWEWKAKFKPVKTAAITTCNKGEVYEFSAAGTWTISKQGKPVTAQGAEDGVGRLLGAVLRDDNGEYALDEPFELGTFGEFTAPSDGNLYLRCRDKWVDLPDNKGSMTVKLKVKGKGDPLPNPTDEPEKKPRAGKASA